MLRASSSETYMSAARCVSVWKLLSGTPNCFRLVRYSVVSRNASSIAPTASAHNADWWRISARDTSAVVSPPSPSGSAAEESRSS